MRKMMDEPGTEEAFFQSANADLKGTHGPSARLGRATQPNFVQKIKACEHAIEATSDPIRREALTILRKLWATLANEVRSLSDHECLADEIAEIERIHIELMRAHSGGTLQ